MYHKNKIKYVIFSLFALSFLFLLSSCFWDTKDNKPSITQTGTVNQDNLEEKTILDELKDLDNLSKNGDYKKSIEILEDKGISNLTEIEKLALLNAYISYGNYYYSESEALENVNKIISSMPESWETNYIKGYANEINNNYTGALENYKKALKSDGITDKNKALIINQIGHLYDLYGYPEIAFKNYESAYSIDKENGQTILNLSRYYTYKGELEKAKEYKLKSLDYIVEKPIKAEIYYGLSSLELELNGLKPDIDKSIDYAKKSIESYPNYPMGYVGLARGLYMKNDKRYYDEIEKNLNKAIELNPNNYLAYKFYTLLELDKGDKEKLTKHIEKASETLYKDPILMRSEIDYQANCLYFYAILSNKILSEDKTNNSIIDIVKGVGGIDYSEVKLQLKRKDYGIFSNLKNDEKFLKLLK